MAKRTLKDRTIKTLKAAQPGQRYDVMDALTPGLGVRVTDKGKRTFVLVTRYPGSKNPTRRALGEYGALSLEQARTKARDWHELIRQGRDPQGEEERRRLAEQRKRANTFAAVAEDFIKEKLPSERKGAEAERDIRREFIPRWGAIPIADITSEDVVAAIKAKRATAPAQARNLLGLIKRMFAWAADQHCYGLTSSVLASVKPSKIIGDKSAGDRVLKDDEIVALWRAARRMPYPHGPVYQLLLLTALRLNEAADASRPELDLQKRIWVIPAARMKGKNSKARSHAVPLTDDILALVEKLPRFNRGKFLFSTTFGEKPVWMTDKVKDRLDARMKRALRALARIRGEDPVEVELTPWVNHDIRRTVRTRLSRLKITEEARGVVLAHVRPGIKGVYDTYDYFDEKREALELWAARLRSIVEPPPANVVSIAKARV
jgi:integrase